MDDHFRLYREARGRIVGLVRGCGAEQRALTVPGCPEWSVADTVAHLAAVATEVMGGVVAGVPGDEHTAAQVAQRRDRTVEEVVAEWDAACDRLASWSPWAPGGPPRPWR